MVRVENLGLVVDECWLEFVLLKVFESTESSPMLKKTWKLMIGLFPPSHLGYSNVDCAFEMRTGLETTP